MVYAVVFLLLFSIVVVHCFCFSFFLSFFLSRRCCLSFSFSISISRSPFSIPFSFSGLHTVHRFLSRRFDRSSLTACPLSPSPPPNPPFPFFLSHFSRVVVVLKVGIRHLRERAVPHGKVLHRRRVQGILERRRQARFSSYGDQEILGRASRQLPRDRTHRHDQVSGADRNGG